MYDVAIIGGGPAGLQAALTLGRMHRRAVLLDGQRYRNATVRHMHNLIGSDGRDPAELRGAARRELARYETVDSRATEVIRIDGTVGSFSLTLVGGEIVEATRVILATGVADTLPDVPGLAPLFGTIAAHCPFCHGHEFAATAVALIGAGAHAPRLAAMLRPIATGVVVLAHGEAIDPDVARALERLDAVIRSERIVSVAPAPHGAEVALEGGGTVSVGGILTTTQWRQAAPFAEQLGLAMTPAGVIAVDAFGRTSVPGISAAGDAAVGPGLPGPMHAVALSIAAGLTAAASIVQDLVAAELANSSDGGSRSHAAG
ncbi:NAD(P)/FAD-dependent oxidoreductase [Microbacterium sp. NPDC096154]|uniref:NAD(P)/FAD-dependent oxidoreductase n=1 Tax=Microbacterium sp. NPDC096154 TaxID=3155549 RepID=UPI0033242377